VTKRPNRCYPKHYKKRFVPTYRKLFFIQASTYPNYARRIPTFQAGLKLGRERGGSDDMYLEIGLVLLGLSFCRVHEKVSYVQDKRLLLNRFSLACHYPSCTRFGSWESHANSTIHPILFLVKVQAPYRVLIQM